MIAQESGAAALPVPLLLGLALVGLSFAAGEAKFNLGPAAFVEIDRQRDNRDAIALDRGRRG